MRALLALALAGSLHAQATSFHWSAGAAYPWQHDASDKQKHVIVGMGLGWAGYGIAQARGWRHPFLGSLLAAFVAGMAKELYDRRHHGRPEWSDVFSTMLGGAAAAGTVEFSYRFGFSQRPTFAKAPPLEP